VVEPELLRVRRGDVSIHSGGFDLTKVPG